MKLKRQIKQVVCICLIFAFFAAASVETAAVSLSSFTSDSIKEKEGQISAAQSQKKELQTGLTDVKKLKKELESQKANLENYVVALDADLAEIQAKIDELKGLIADKEGEIEVTQAELEEAIAVQRACTTSRLREAERISAVLILKWSLTVLIISSIVISFCV